MLMTSSVLQLIKCGNDLTYYMDIYMYLYSSCHFVLPLQSGGHSGMEDDPGMASPSNLSSRGAGSQMSPSNSETSESRCKFTDHLYHDLPPHHNVICSFYLAKKCCL